MKKAISTEQNAENISAVTEILAGTHASLTALRGPLTATRLREPLGPGERSFTEVLAHLLHCEARTAEAIYLALMVNEPLLAAVHPERHIGKLLRYDQQPFDDLLAYFKFRRTVLLRVLGELTEKQWARTVREPGKQRQESVYLQARVQALHEADHLAAVEALLA
jgi:hypothetical protein